MDCNDLVKSEPIHPVSEEDTQCDWPQVKAETDDTEFSEMAENMTTHHSPSEGGSNESNCIDPSRNSKMSDSIRRENESDIQLKNKYECPAVTEVDYMYESIHVKSEPAEEAEYYTRQTHLGLVSLLSGNAKVKQEVDNKSETESTSGTRTVAQDGEEDDVQKWEVIDGNILTKAKQDMTECQPCSSAPGLIPPYPTGEILRAAPPLESTGISRLKSETAQETPSWETNAVSETIVPSDPGLAQEINAENTSYTCDVCQVVCKGPFSLEVHQRIHNVEKSFQCEVCGKSFQHKCNFNRHMKTHTGERPYKCNICDKAFTCNRSVNRHKLLHTGEKPFKCDTCNTSFRESCHLVVHQRIHTGERPYKCDSCEKAFRSAGDLARHMRTHTKEKPYKCDSCKESFAQSATLSNHKKRFHKKVVVAEGTIS